MIIEELSDGSANFQYMEGRAKIEGIHLITLLRAALVVGVRVYFEEGKEVWELRDD